MARNTDITTGSGLDEGLIQLTLLSPSEHRKCNAGEDPPHPVTALLTARGKDHDMTPEQLEKLGKACLKYAKLMRENYG